MDTLPRNTYGVIPPDNVMTDFHDRFRQTCVPHAPAPTSQPDGSRAPAPPTSPFLMDADDAERESFFNRIFLPDYTRAVRMAQGHRGLDCAFELLPIELQRQFRVDARRALALGQASPRSFATTAIGLCILDSLVNLFARPHQEVNAIVTDEMALEGFAERLAEVCAAAFLRALTAPEAQLLADVRDGAQA